MYALDALLAGRHLIDLIQQGRTTDMFAPIDNRHGYNTRYYLFRHQKDIFSDDGLMSYELVMAAEEFHLLSVFSSNTYLNNVNISGEDCACVKEVN
jgi:hypothetical protein